MEDLTPREQEILRPLLLPVIHRLMDEAGMRNDDETFKELATLARKLGDGQ